LVKAKNQEHEILNQVQMTAFDVFTLGQLATALSKDGSLLLDGQRRTALLPDEVGTGLALALLQISKTRSFSPDLHNPFPTTVLYLF
jgi:hypothetical protein